VGSLVVYTGGEGDDRGARAAGGGALALGVRDSVPVTTVGVRAVSAVCRPVMREGLHWRRH